MGLCNMGTIPDVNNVAFSVIVCGYCHWRSDSSNKPFEWTGLHRFPASVVFFLPATQGQR